MRVRKLAAQREALQREGERERIRFRQMRLVAFAPQLKYRFTVSQIVGHEVLHLRLGLLMSDSGSDILDSALHGIVIHRRQDGLHLGTARDKEREREMCERVAEEEGRERGPT